ncbi:SPS1-related proline-alanine-rich protein kinase [Seminavis robusta]|uniref:SPS1-related proline-alanine-rich protein kinase n=1 Tax=Seminavis robusta TaxID=568900 RepID=A0A9N8HS62_9STRA|nr:SPS1-related proline-alanine-rich protein kinase [Seminavis robusta]|eukprot:Sro1401_g269500.1 SPS1-related proline-alanine-rich protein kinase (469) ;mRNA; f:24524-25930
MSSGSLPLATYHRTQALGEGSFGSVVTVYNDDGEEFAMKLFIPDDEEDNDETLELGALLEISILRLLRESNGHVNIVEIADVQGDYCDDEDEAGAGTSGCLGMAMPLYPLGSLEQAIDSQSPLIQKRADKIRISHGILSAVNYLHENGLMHRDIKASNIMLAQDEENDTIKPVLIDFSLVKIVDGTMFGNSDYSFPPLGEDEDEPTTHTGQAGTATYMSPEVNDCEPYGLRADLWSVGVVLLELLQKSTLQAVKASQAESLIQERLQKLPQDKPFPTMVRKLLQRDPEERWTARQCLEHMSTSLFANYDVPPVKTICLKQALPFDEDKEEEEENVAPTAGSRDKKTPRKPPRVDPVVERRRKNIRKLCHELDCQHPMTLHAANCFCERMLELDDELDDLKASQTMLDCVVLAHKVFEVEMLDLNSLEEEYKSFAEWDLDTYRDNESTILMMMDYCLYPRELVAGLVDR